jgi:uncharacterized protein YcfJ
MKPTTGLMVTLMGAIGTAQASHEYDAGGGSFYTYARVLDVEPIVRIVQVSEPRESCWTERVRQAGYGRGYRSHTPAVLGGIIGGVLGHQFGSGRGNDVMTVAGALLGASVGRDEAYRRQARAYPVYANERVCEMTETVREEERLEGYRVRYLLDGREFVTRTETDPGPRIRVRVQVDPATYN